MKKHPSSRPANGGQVVGDVLTFETETSQKKDRSYGTLFCFFGVTPVIFVFQSQARFGLNGLCL